MSTPDSTRPSLESNKREMFDAMRAYHGSELAHKHDAVLILTTIITATGAVLAAVLFSEREIPYSQILVQIVAIYGTIAIFWIIYTTNQKIENDHKVYAELGKEYVYTSELLGYFDSNWPSEQSHRSVKTNKEIGSGKGYKHTQKILTGMSIIIVGLIWILTEYTSFVLIPMRANEVQKSIRITINNKKTEENCTHHSIIEIKQLPKDSKANNCTALVINADSGTRADSPSQ